MAAADMLLHTSLEESFGVVLAEAMALGLPVVAGRDSGAVPWILEADAQGRVACGRAVDVSAVDAIAGALVAVFKAGYADMSAAGRRSATQRFAVSSIAAAYGALYQRLTQVALHPAGR